MLNHSEKLHLFSKPKIHTGKIGSIIYYSSPTRVGCFGGHYQGALQEC